MYICNILSKFYELGIEIKYITYIFILTDDTEIDLYPEPESSNGKRSPSAYQCDVTVASEVLQGIKLRQRKPYERRYKYPTIIDVPKPERICKRYRDRVCKKKTNCESRFLR